MAQTTKAASPAMTTKNAFMSRADSTGGKGHFFKAQSGFQTTGTGGQMGRTPFDLAEAGLPATADSGTGSINLGQVGHDTAYTDVRL